MKNIHVAVISHKRPENVQPLRKLLNVPLWWYVNKGESKAYLKAGAEHVVECGTNICHARNRAKLDAGNNFCVQVSDDLKGIKVVSKPRVQKPIQFVDVVADLVMQLKLSKLHYAGVAVSNNALNYTGEDWSYDKLVVNDLIVLAPKCRYFDEHIALKEDYDLSINELIYTGGVLRADKYLCNFPHRENKGGANIYRNSKTEEQATLKLIAKWGAFVKRNPKRPGQVLLNYKLIRMARQQLLDTVKHRTV